MANESLKKQMVIKLGTTTNEDAQIINNMVDNAAGGGGGGSAMVIHTTDDGAQYVMDKTFGEILEAFTSGTFITVNLTAQNDKSTGLVLGTFYNLYEGEISQCIVAVGDASAAAPYKYTANSESDYPAYYYAD